MGGHLVSTAGEDGSLSRRLVALSRWLLLLHFGNPFQLEGETVASATPGRGETSRARAPQAEAQAFYNNRISYDSNQTSDSEPLWDCDLELRAENHS